MIRRPTDRSRLLAADLPRLGLAGASSARLRATLAILGIAIGIAAIVTIVGVSESSRANLLAQLDRLGTDLLTVKPDNRFVRSAQNDVPRTAEPMIRRIAPVTHVAATVATNATVRRTDKVPAFLTGAEALTLSTLGGVLGILAGLLITVAYARERHWSTATSPAFIAAALAAALTAGLIAGLLPAARAARLSPTDALRSWT